MKDRSDALVTASCLIAAVRDTALESDLGVATVGVISSDTSSQATIPAGVHFIIDIRCSTDELVEQLVAAIFKKFDQIILQEANKTTYHIARTWRLPESIFHEHCIEAVRESARTLLDEDQIMDIKSRAGHDSAWTSRVCPTSMIFVLSKDGISHNPHEYTSPDHCAIGAQVLLDAVSYYDKKLRRGDCASTLR